MAEPVVLSPFADDRLKGEEPTKLTEHNCSSNLIGSDDHRDADASLRQNVV